MYDLRRFFATQYLAGRALVCGLGLAAFSLSVSAQTDLSLTYADQISRRFLMEARGNEIFATWSASGGSTFPAATGKPVVPVATGLSPTAGEISRYGSGLTKYGQVPFKLSQTITAARVAKGIGAVAGGPLGIGLLALSFTADWLSDAGVSFDPATGDPRFSDPNVCSSAPCYQWQLQTGAYSRDRYAVCLSRATHQGGGAGAPAPTAVVFTQAGSTLNCSAEIGYTGSRYTWTSSYYGVSVAPLPVSYVYPSETELADKLVSKPRTTSEIEKILSETIKYPEIQPDPADPVRIDPVTPGQPIKTPTKTDTKTTTNPDGSKIEETKSCWVKGTVQTGASLKLTEVCNTDTVTKSPSGTVTGTTTATTDSETSDAAEPVKDDSGFCETLIGKLLCADLDTPDAEPIDKTTKTLTYAPENHFGGGACPADQFMTTHTGQTLKVSDWATSCDKINQFFRPLFLTLCAFTALMILAPAVKEA